MSADTINNISKLEKKLNIQINKEQHKYLNEYFKNKFFNIQNKKIVYPKIKDIKEINKKHYERLKKLKEIKTFWSKQNKSAKNYYKKIKLTKYFKQNYWKHKIKEMTNNEYSKDVKDINLQEDTLMDPEYKNLLNTFIVDPDYRKKLKRTVNDSIIYKDSKIGDNSKKRQKFKEEISTSKLKKIDKQIAEVKFKIKMNKIILKIIN